MIHGVSIILFIIFMWKYDVLFINNNEIIISVYLLCLIDLKIEIMNLINKHIIIYILIIYSLSNFNNSFKYLIYYIE